MRTEKRHLTLGIIITSLLFITWKVEAIKPCQWLCGNTQHFWICQDSEECWYECHTTLGGAEVWFDSNCTSGPAKGCSMNCCNLSH